MAKQTYRQHLNPILIRLYRKLFNPRESAGLYDHRYDVTITSDLARRAFDAYELSGKKQKVEVGRRKLLEVLLPG